MATIMSAAPIDAAAVLSDALIEQYVKPAGGQTALLDAFRATAIGWVEGHTAKSLARRRWTVAFDGFGGMLRLPREPVRSILSVDYVDPAGATITGSGLWRQAGAQMLPGSGAGWPSTAAGRATVIVAFEAGFDDIGSEAPALRIAVLMLVKHLYDGGSLDDMPATIAMLIDEAYRTPVIG